MKYCGYHQCPIDDCQYHIRHAPNGTAVTTSNMDENCDCLAEHRAYEDKVKEQNARMTFGDAYVIFKNIDTVDLDDRVKGTAIMKVASLETHNGITKEDMVKVIKYLLPLAFEFGEGDTR